MLNTIQYNVAKKLSLSSLKNTPPSYFPPSFILPYDFHPFVPFSAHGYASLGWRSHSSLKNIFIHHILTLCWCKMMGVEGEESEEKIPRAFITRVDDFNRESEAIFSEFEAIKEKYKRGEDVMADLKQFRSKRPGIFTLIDDLYHKEVEFEDKLERAQIDEDKRQKMLEFKQRFAELADEIDLLVLGELGLER